MSNPVDVFHTIPSEAPSADNVVRVYDGTTELERRRGANWYLNAWRFSRMLAETHWHRGEQVRNIGSGTQRKTAQAAGIVAALAQQTSWERNQELAIETFAARGQLAGGTFTSVVDKCRAIFDGSSPWDVLGGPKIRAFYACIIAQGECADVTVDRHAYHIARGRVLADRERNNALKRKGGYEDAELAYQQATALINHRDSEHWSPAQIQAITWVAWRNVLLGEERGHLDPAQL